MQVASKVGHNVADLELQKAQATQAYITAASIELKKAIEVEIDKLRCANEKTPGKSEIN